MGDGVDELLNTLAIAVIGPVTRKAVEQAGLNVEIMPRHATIEALVDEIRQWVLKN